MQKSLLSKNFFVVLGIDIIILAGSFYIAHLVRFEFNIPQNFLYLFLKMLPIVLVIKIISFSGIFTLKLPPSPDCRRISYARFAAFRMDSFIRDTAPFQFE